jgi:S-adenosylmethionine:tRNA ribosyltransferase-isomerase
MNIDEFDYHLPPDFIAQKPIEPRDSSRLMILNRADNSIGHRHFYDVTDYLNSGDTLVFNNTRVIPARLSGVKSESDTKIELLLLRRLENGIWETLSRPSKKLRAGTKVFIKGKAAKGNNKLTAEVIEKGQGGILFVRFSNERLLNTFGEIPLPPYIRTPLQEAERYQTIYAKIKGSAAAPTAGLHFTSELLDKLQQKGVNLAFTTLHIGLDTFQPVRVSDPKDHQIHKEYGILSPETAKLLNQTKAAGKRIIVVGTSSVRLIEAAAQFDSIQPVSNWINLFILPGYKYRAADAMITNFHLPKSTLLMLVSAFAGRDFIFKAYQEAIKQKYRFYSFGDAMLIL